MSDPQPTPEPKSWTPPASQEEFNKIIGDRLARDRAKAAEDAKPELDALRAAKAKLDEIENGQKTELQKVNERLDQVEQARKAAEQTASQREQELLRYRVAADKGITGKELKLLHGATEQELAEAADVIVELRRGTQPRDPGQGAGGGTPRESAGLAEARRRFGTAAGQTK